MIISLFHNSSQAAICAFSNRSMPSSLAKMVNRSASLCGSGGMLQSVIFGIGGVDIIETGLTNLDTKLPKAWKSLTITGLGINEETVEKK